MSSSMAGFLRECIGRFRVGQKSFNQPLNSGFVKSLIVIT